MNREIKPQPQIEMLLALSDRERRRIAGNAIRNHLAGQGFDGITYVSNVDDALPPSAREAIINHGVPARAYGGRMLGMALALAPDTKSQVNVVMEEPLVKSELDFWQHFTSQTGIVLPTIIPKREAIGDNDFIYPFIGSKYINNEFPGRTLPDSERFNRKADMRKRLRKLGEEQSLVPGVEIFYEGDEAKHYDKIAKVLKERAEATGQTQWLKHSFTASGLASMKVSSEQARNSTYIQQKLRGMFQSENDPSITYPDDVVVEDGIDFGNSPSGYGDFSLRGMALPDGSFMPLSIGRVISNAKGEYLGMVMVQGNKMQQLKNIGLDPMTYVKSVEVFSKLVADIHKDGYTFGPVSVDYFSQQNNSAADVHTRDYNIREGGTTIGGVITSYADRIWPDAQGVLDVELHIISDQPLDEKGFNQLVQSFQQERCIPYATTFLRYPKLIETDNPDARLYTIKVLSPYTGTALTDDSVVEAMRDMVDTMNNRSSMKGVTYHSPL